MSGVEFRKSLVNFIGKIMNPNKIDAGQNSVNNVPVGQAEEAKNVATIDDVLAQDLRAIYGKALTLSNKLTNPIRLGDKLESFVPDLTEMFNATRNQSLADDVAKFTQQERFDVTKAFQTAQVREAMRIIAEETPDDAQARIEQSFMSNFA